MNRREFFQCAVLLASGASASRLGWALSGEQQRHLAASPPFIDDPVDFFTPQQRLEVAAMTEVIIPRTETPGAIDAGVPHFVELMVANWFNEGERAIFMAGLGQLTADCQSHSGAPFHKLGGDQQLAILERMEDEASGSPWYDLGNVQRVWVEDAPFICQVKELTVYGFFTSELGATQVLRHEMMPMYFDGDTELGPEDSSWAKGLL